MLWSKKMSIALKIRRKVTFQKKRCEFDNWFTASLLLSLSETVVVFVNFRLSVVVVAEVDVGSLYR